MKQPLCLTIIFIAACKSWEISEERNECLSIHFENETVLVHGALNEITKTPVYIVVNPNKTYYKKIQKINSFVFLSDLNQFVSALKLIYNTPAWNSRAKYIVYANSDVLEYFKEAWKYFILNLNVVDVRSKEVFRYYPYKKGSCGETVDYEYVGDCSSKEQYNFPQKIPNDLNGCKVKLMPYAIQPYVLNIRAPREIPSLAGLEVTIAHVLSQRMNFTEQYVKNPHVHWGYRFSDGTYSLMFKSLYEHETDIIFGFTYGNASYTIDFDASFCHLTESSVWFVPTAITIPQWKNLTAIFEPRLWYAIFFMLVLNGTAWWILGKQEMVEEFKDLVLCVMMSLYVLLQGSVACPSIWKLRSVFSLWLLTCLLIFTAHQCQLISILTNPLYEKQISTLQEMLDSKIEYGFYPTIEDAYNDQTNLVHQTIRKNYQVCPLTTECLNRTAFNRDFAVVKNRRQALYLMPRYYTYPNGRPKLFELYEIAFSSRPRYHVRKGFPFLERFDGLLMLLQSSGLVDKWDKDSRFKVLKIESDPDHEPLSLVHLQGAFFVLAFGMALSWCVLLAESASAKITRRKP